MGMIESRPVIGLLDDADDIDLDVTRVFKQCLGGY